MKKMGPKSRNFREQTLNLLASNPQRVPPNLGLEEKLADRAALGQLRPRLQPLRELVERGNDIKTALGCDMMTIALDGLPPAGLVGQGWGAQECTA